MANELAKYMDMNGEEITITLDDVRQRICPEASDKDIALFAAQAKIFNANPWANEIYLVGYNGKDGFKASVILSYHLFNKVASQQEDYDGIESGVTVMSSNGDIQHRGSGECYPEFGDKLLGAWAKVYRKGIAHPFMSGVKFSEYDKNTNIWKEMPTFMIEKVAKCQAWRLAYPAVFANVYESSEIDGGKTSTARREAPTEVVEVQVEDVSQGASDAAKKALNEACQRYADRHGVEVKDVRNGVRKRPDYVETDEYFEAVAAELDGEVA